MRNVPNLHRIDDLARIPATPCSDGGVRLVRAAQADRSQSSLALRLWYMSFTSRMGIPLDCSTLSHLIWRHLPPRLHLVQL